MTLEVLCETIALNRISPKKAALIALTKAYLKHYPNLEVKNERGYTLLHEAVESGDLNLVTYLLEKGAQVDSVDKKQHTPLMIASLNGDLAIMKCLLEKGANSNAQNHNRMTALMLVAQKVPFEKPEEDTVELLLGYQANMNIHELYGARVINSIIPQEKVALIEYFLSKGATIGVKEIHQIQKRELLTQEEIFELLESAHCSISMTSYPIDFLQQTVDLLTSSCNLNANSLEALKPYNYYVPSELFTLEGIRKYLTYQSHNEKIQAKAIEIPFQIAYQTPLLDKLSILIAQYITAQSNFHDSFQEHFQQGRVLRMSTTPSNSLSISLAPLESEALHTEKVKTTPS